MSLDQWNKNRTVIVNGYRFSRLLDTALVAAQYPARIDRVVASVWRKTLSQTVGGLLWLTPPLLKHAMLRTPTCTKNVYLLDG